MSLASLLLTGDKQATCNQNVDGDLDALFRSNPAPPIVPHPPRGNPITVPQNPPSPSSTRGHKRKRQQEAPKAESERPAAPQKAGASKAAKRKKVAVISEEHSSSSGKDEDDDDDDDDDAGLEDAYLTRHTVPADAEPPSDHESSAEDDEPPQHETHSTASPRKRVKPRKKAKYVPPEETPAQRDARTIFVGNIPVDVAKSKSSQKQLKKHFTSHVAGAKIESVRFRSVAFATATTPLPTEDGKPPRSTTASTKQQRQKERAATWRDADDHGSDRDDDHAPPKKPAFLTPAEKKRVAFIKGDFHKEVDTVNAYVVFAHSPPDDDAADALSPVEAARLAVAQCDSTVFLERTIRVDRVGQWRAGSGADTDDPRATLFVGNLDFATHEEDLRVWFEGVVSQARGPGPAPWVRRVRIVRDRDTQLGKGFAYVRFAERACVDEVLALEREALRFAKRTLRVQRCKAGGGALPKAKASKSAPTPKAVRAKPAPVHVPAGDPLLGKKLAGLSKEDRKAAKAANVDRVHRRLAKKKAQAGVERELQKRDGKVRDRERKKGGKADRAKPAPHKGRMRSEKSVEKRNLKK